MQHFLCLFVCVVSMLMFHSLRLHIFLTQELVFYLRSLAPGYVLMITHSLGRVYLQSGLTGVCKSAHISTAG